MDRRPTVTLTFAQSLDGRMATRGGVSQWISGPETLTLAHELRDKNDAVLVGIGTVLADNPQLTCRMPNGRSPVRVVLDSALRLPLDCHIAAETNMADSVVFTSHDTDAARMQALRQCGVRVVPVSRNDEGKLHLGEILHGLVEIGIESVLVEGGAQTVTSFVRAGLWDRLVAVIAPMFIGKGTDTIGELGVTDLNRADRFRTVSLHQAGNDVVWELEPIRD